MEKEKAPEIVKKIEFKDVSFAYEDSNIDILKNFSRTIKGGKTVVL